METIILKGGLYFDGLGGQGVLKDVVIKDGKIDQIFDFTPEIKNTVMIDVTGKWVLPGLIDAHTHYDAEVEVLPGLEESVRHGVTTIIMGNCSLSATLGNDKEIIDLFSRVESIPAQVLGGWLVNQITWKTPQEYYEHLSTLPLGPNVASFIGHSNVRMAAMGLERSLTVHQANSQELTKMKDLVADAMDAGYLGLSIDMLPFHRWAGEMIPKFTGVSVPSQQASLSEYYQLANVVRRYGRILEATPNAIRKESMIYIMLMSSGLWQRKLKTMVIAALDFKSSSKMSHLFKIAANMANGVFRGDFRLQTLSTPFLNYGDGIIQALLEELDSVSHVIGLPAEKRQALFRSPAFRTQFRQEWNHKSASVFPRNLHDMHVTKSPDLTHIGKNFVQIAYEQQKDPLDHFMDLIAHYDTAIRWQIVCANADERTRVSLQAHPYMMPAFNDSGAHNRNMAFHDGALHTLADAQRNPDLLTPEQAIYRLTKMQADWFGIDAGDISVGKRADITVIDPNKLQTDLTLTPTEDYHPKLAGAMRLVKRSGEVVQFVFINGKLIYQNDQGQALFNPKINQEPFGKLLKSLF